MSEANQLSEAQRSALAEAFSGTVTPYSQIRESLGLDQGQYDFFIKSLTPDLDKNGMYCIVGEFTVLAPVGFAHPYKRTLYVGTKKDKLAQLPETRLNSPGLRFLKQIATANKLPTNDQSDAALCATILNKSFGVRIEDAPYEVTNADGSKTTKKGSEFGRNVTPAGMIPAKLDHQAAAPVGANGAVHEAVAGAQFATE